jgi:hypothetical protein
MRHRVCSLATTSESCQRGACDEYRLAERLRRVSAGVSDGRPCSLRHPLHVHLHGMRRLDVQPSGHTTRRRGADHVLEQRLLAGGEIGTAPTGGLHSCHRATNICGALLDRTAHMHGEAVPWRDHEAHGAVAEG